MSNLNEAVRLIIERLKTNPEDFWGELNEDTRNPMLRKDTYPKFRGVARDIEYLLRGPHESEMVREKSASTVFWFLTDEERAALTAAYTEAKRERFTAEIFHTLLTKPDPNPYVTSASQYATNIATGATISMVGASDSSVRYTGNSISGKGGSV